MVDTFFFTRLFDEVIDRFAEMHLNFSHGVDADDIPESNCEIDEPIHIVNIAILYQELKSDKELSTLFHDICQERVSYANWQHILIRSEVLYVVNYEIYQVNYPDQGHTVATWGVFMCPPPPHKFPVPQASPKNHA